MYVYGCYPVSGIKQREGHTVLFVPLTNTFITSMEQRPENATLLRLQSVETSYINHILKGIDDLLQYRGAQVLITVLLELKNALCIANDAVEQFADEPTKEEAWLDHEYLRDTGRDVDKIVSFLAGIFDEYRKLEIIREIIKETTQKIGVY
jgi:c-di-AMP phosphodiesterase-like protein